MQKNGYLSWDETRNKKMRKLSSDILQGHYTIYLQPKIDLATDFMESAEVLIRYQTHDETILPDAFIQDFEDFEIIHVLDLYVFEVACYYLHKWQVEGHEKISLACNLSKRTLQQAGLVGTLNRIREYYEIDAAQLEIEITESMQGLDMHFYESVGEHLKNSGYQLTLDDFGSGYSNFVFLSSMPFTCIKFDKDATQAINKGSRMKTLFKNMILTSHEMGMKVVAEGVENILQKDILKKLDCDYIQGYLVDKPMSVDDFESLYMT